jgi:UDP-GlcNAc:undecaprenyl-phosphate GlcNAc-1-phosphate transferase
MLNVLLTLTIAFAITLMAIPAIIRVANEKKLYDIPDARKLHSKPIASLGGVGIFLGFSIAFLLSLAASGTPEFQYIMAASIVTFFLGLKDDILILSATKKFLVQVAAAALLIHMGGLRIESMYGIFDIYELPALVSYAVTYITIIVVINAYNLIDGVDGLAGSLGLLTMSIFGTYFLAEGLLGYSMMAFALAGSLGAFLVFNHHPARIFMGDSGSLLLGLINAVMVIKFIQVAGSPSALFPLGSAVAIGFSILIIPLLDTLRVFSIRISRGRSPFSPDRNHIHHLLLDRGLSHGSVTLTCLMLNIFFIGVAYLGQSIGSTYLIGLMMCTCYGLVGALIYFRKPQHKLAVSRTFASSKEQVSPATTKVVSMKPDAVVAEQ